MKPRTLNKVQLIGNIVKKPIVKDYANGIKVCFITIATNYTFKNPEDEIIENTDFHNLIAFSKLAEICEKLLDEKMLIYVEGELRNKKFQDSTGKDHLKAEVKITEMLVLNKKDPIEENYNKIQDDSYNKLY